MARCTSVVFEIWGNLAYEDGHVGIYHSQAEWTDGIKDLVWSTDREESTTNYAVAVNQFPGVVSRVLQATGTYTLDNGTTEVGTTVVDAQGNTYAVDETSTYDNAAEINTLMLALYAYIT